MEKEGSKDEILVAENDNAGDSGNSDWGKTGSQKGASSMVV